MAAIYSSPVVSSTVRASSTRAPLSLIGESAAAEALRGEIQFAAQSDAKVLVTGEVGEMSARMQAVLLRFLETGELQRVGADRVHARVNVRVIAATNRNLLSEIEAGRFREDL